MVAIKVFVGYLLNDIIPFKDPKVYLLLTLEAERCSSTSMVRRSIQNAMQRLKSEF